MQSELTLALHPVASPRPAGKSRGAAAIALTGSLILAALLTSFLAAPAAAAETFFNSSAAYKEEASRVAGEGKLFVEGPVRPYWPESLAVAGAFAVSYAFDRDIRSRLGAAHSGALSSLTDWGSLSGEPFVQIGVTATLYAAGAASDSPRLLRLGEEMGEALLFADGSTLLLKQAVGRGRPGTGDGNSRYRPFQFTRDYDSLPSMHTASSFALAHVLSSHTDSLPVQILCYAAAGFVGFSRLYQEKHWASDIVLGAALGELAGNSVTRYYALHGGKVALAPVAIDGTPSLALVGKF
jgi:membrane-associated phospholipid phosphatase